MTRSRHITRRQAVLGIAAMVGAGAAIRTTGAAAASGVLYPDMIGRLEHHLTVAQDTLVELAPRYGLGYTELVAANPGIDPWIPGAGRRLVLPTAHLVPLAKREGLVVNLADQRLYLFQPKSGTVDTAPIGIGSAGWRTPLGRTRVSRKRVKPTWYVPKSIRAEQPDLPAAVGPGPNNPLGGYAVDLAWPSYLIHGTNEPLGVGRRVSHGCVRLYPADIERLFAKVTIGLPVAIVDQPVKLGRVAGRLLLEAHPTQSQADELENFGKFTPAEEPELEFRVLSAAGDAADRIDWKRVRRAVYDRRGIPLEILLAN